MAYIKRKKEKEKSELTDLKRNMLLIQRHISLSHFLKKSKVSNNEK